MSLGMKVQHYMDAKVMNIMDDTINGCVDFMENLHHGRPKREKKPMEWVSVDAQDSRA